MSPSSDRSADTMTLDVSTAKSNTLSTIGEVHKKEMPELDRRPEVLGKASEDSETTAVPFD